MFLFHNAPFLDKVYLAHNVALCTMTQGYVYVIVYLLNFLMTLLSFLEVDPSTRFVELVIEILDLVDGILYRCRTWICLKVTLCSCCFVE